MKTNIFFALLMFSSLCLADTTLLLVGGGKRPVKAMAKFVESSGASKASILVIPWASGTTEGAENIKRELLTHSPAEVEIVSHELSADQLTALKEKIKSISGVFFTGGNQNQLMKFMRRYELVETFRTAFKNGMAFAGTSAGTAIMSNPMLTGNSDLSVINPTKNEIAEGLGLLPSHVIVDQHFILRSRFNRLASLILGETEKLGIGIDEDNALFITNNETAEVIGPTQVMFYTSSSSKDLKLKILTEGDTYKLNN
jgi:cyanophycinase